MQLELGEMTVFGDSTKNIVTLEMVKYSYAMANADESVKAVANFQAPAKTEAGVLKVLKNLLKEI